MTNSVGDMWSVRGDVGTSTSFLIPKLVLCQAWHLVTQGLESDSSLVNHLCDIT